jgi:hypothetical protein
MYFLLGSLPWQGLKIKQGEEQFQKIAEKKYNTPFEELCRGQPNEFLMYFKHVDQLEFEEEPKYDFLISLFQEMINKYCNNCYYEFDWNKNAMKHLNENQQINGKDVSLLVNKNNGQSTLNESKNGTKLEVNNDDFEGENIKKDNFYIKEHLNFEETNFNNSDFNYTNMNNFNNSNDNNNFNNNNNFETERKKKIKSIGRSSSDIDKEIKKKNSYKKNNIPKLTEKNNSGNNNVNHLSNSHNYIHKKSNKLKYSKKNLTVITKDNDYLYDSNNTNNYKHNNNKENNNKENNNREYNINKKLDFNDINIEITNNKHNNNKDNNKDESNNKRKKHRKHKSMENVNDYKDDDTKCQCKIF